MLLALFPRNLLALEPALPLDLRYGLLEDGKTLIRNVLGYVEGRHEAGGIGATAQDEQALLEGTLDDLVAYLQR